MEDSSHLHPPSSIVQEDWKRKWLLFSFISFIIILGLPYWWITTDIEKSKIPTIGNVDLIRNLKILNFNIFINIQDPIEWKKSSQATGFPPQNLIINSYKINLQIHPYSFQLSNNLNNDDKIQTIQDLEIELYETFDLKNGGISIFMINESISHLFTQSPSPSLSQPSKLSNESNNNSLKNKSNKTPFQIYLGRKSVIISNVSKSNIPITTQETIPLIMENIEFIMKKFYNDPYQLNSEIILKPKFSYHIIVSLLYSSNLIGEKGENEIIIQIKESLEPIVQAIDLNIKVSIQSRYFARSKWTGSGIEQLKTFIDSTNWAIGQGIDIYSKPIHIILYWCEEENCNEQPGSWLYPQWGSVILLGKGREENIESTSSSSPNTSSIRIYHENSELKNVLSGHVMSLFGLHNQYIQNGNEEIKENEIMIDPLNSITMNRWRMEMSKLSINNAIHTLNALDALLTENENIVIKPEISQLYKRAIRKIIQGQEILDRFSTFPSSPLIHSPSSNPIHDSNSPSFKNNKSARERGGGKKSVNPSKYQRLILEGMELAEQVFFHPTMMALQYFPQEHKMGVYAPLFFPVLFPLLLSTVRILMAHIKRNRINISNNPM